MVDCGVAVINGSHLLSSRFPLALMSPRITFPTEFVEISINVHKCTPV